MTKIHEVEDTVPEFLNRLADYDTAGVLYPWGLCYNQDLTVEDITQELSTRK